MVGGGEGRYPGIVHSTRPPPPACQGIHVGTKGVGARKVQVSICGGKLSGTGAYIRYVGFGYPTLSEELAENKAHRAGPREGSERATASHNDSEL